MRPLAGFIFVVCLSSVTVQISGVASPAVLGVSARVSSSQQANSKTAEQLVKRQEPGGEVTSPEDSAGDDTTNSEENSGDRVLSVLSYWYVLLVLLIVVAVFIVCLCACVVKKKRQSHQSLRMEMRSYHSPASNPSTRQLSSTGEHSAIPQHTSSSFLDPTSSPGSLSMDPTPIPSPQPSFTSSQRSARSSGRGSRKRHRNHSPGHMSSGSEDTMRPHKSHSALSLGSTGSSRSVGHMGMPRVIRTESQSSGERSVTSAPSSHSRNHRRTTSNTIVKITPVGGVADSTSLRSASSMASMASVGSNHSGRSNRSSASNRSGMLMRSRSNSSPNTLVEVDVKVHLCNEEEREARTEIAAALAESARQLAQSAANFDLEEQEEERQKRGWYSKSLPHNSHSSSLPLRTSLGTTHSLPLQSNKRKLFSSYSSTNLPPYSRELVYTPNLPSSGHTPPMASLDRPRHLVSVDHPSPTYHAYENYRRSNSSHRAPPPESVRPNSRLSSPSQRSLSSNSEYAPAHYYNMQLPPVHLRPHRLLSRRVSEPGGVGDGVGGAYQNHNPAFLGHIHSNRLRNLNGSQPLSVASLDFHSMKSQSQKSHVPRMNGMTNPMYANHDLHAQLEDVNLRQESLEVGGMRNENGSDSNTSTLCGSSHSSTMDNKNRLSRVSEKSEHNENDGEQQKTNKEDNEQGSSSSGEETDHNQLQQEVNLDQLSIAKQRSYPPGRDARYLTLPNHYKKITIQQPPSAAEMATPTTEGAHDQGQPGEPARVYYSGHGLPLSPSSSSETPLPSVKQSPPHRKPKQRPLPQAVSDSDLKNGTVEDKDSTSIGSTLPRSPTSSTCLSSQSIQSVRDETGTDEETHSAVERRVSLPDVTMRDPAPNGVPSAEPNPLPSDLRTQSLPRCGTTLSTDARPSNTTGYANASSNGDKNETVTKPRLQESPPSPAKSGNSNDRMLGQSDVEVLNVRLGSQLSYPLQKLLSQPVSYEIDSDDFESLDPHHVTHFHHRSNMYHPHRTSRSRGHTYVNANESNFPLPHVQAQGFHGMSHRSLDHMRLSNHISFNPVAGLGRPVRGSPGLPNVAVPPPLGGITVDIDV